MKTRHTTHSKACALAAAGSVLASGLLLSVGAAAQEVLPIPEPKYPHSTVFDARKASPPAQI